MGIEDWQDQSLKAGFRENVHPIVDFVIGVLRIDGYANLSMLNDMCLLILELCTFYPREIGLKQKLTSEVIEQLLNQISVNGDQEIKALATRTFN